jgi:hypothetical protein
MVITDHQEWRAAFEKAGYLVVGGSKESLSRGVTKDLCEEEEDGEERLEESWRPQSWELQDRALMLRKRRQQAARERRAYLEAAWQKEEDAA